MEVRTLTKRFLAMFPYLWEVEGTVYENDPDDPGGATKFGIDQRSHPNVNIRNLTEAQAKEIYFSEYWKKYGCEKLAFPLGEAYFDVCVNNGAGRAKKLMQLSNGDVRRFLEERDAFYRRLAQARPASRKYLKGWLNRNNKLRKLLGL